MEQATIIGIDISKKSFHQSSAAFRSAMLTQ